MQKETKTMRTAGCLLAGLFWLGAAAWTPGTAADPKPADIQARAKSLVALLAKGDYANAGKDFDKTMKKVLPPKELEKLWKGLMEKYGALKKQQGVRTERGEKYEFVFVSCTFEKGPLDVKVVFTKDGEITGMFFTFPKSKVKYKAPDYVNEKAFHEKEVKFGLEKWRLPGTLTMPVGNGPFPAVVLVHGSGSHDRDETLGPNKPFRDLAGGLASRGVAVLRYEKRTHAYATEMARTKHFPSLHEEVIDDAVTAAAFLRKAKGIDPKKVFVLGHSLGATVVPQIGNEDADIKGLISLAGTTRPLEDVILEQITYILSLKGSAVDKSKEELEKIKKQVARLKDPKFSKDIPAKELPLGIPASYWLDLRKFFPAQTVGKCMQPILVLQGERDYQVTMEDLKGWKKLLTGRKNVQFKSYPRLNHLFMDGKGKATPSEYEKAGHVDKEVIEDIAAWVKKQ
jgi:dienelactone hydrolase